MSRLVAGEHLNPLIDAERAPAVMLGGHAPKRQTVGAADRLPETLPCLLHSLPSGHIVQRAGRKDSLRSLPPSAPIADHRAQAIGQRQPWVTFDAQADDCAF